MNDDDLRRAQLDLESAYSMFDNAVDPRLVDAAILRIRSAQMQLDFLTHPAPPADEPFALPWLEEGLGG